MKRYIVFLLAWLLIGCETILNNADDLANAAIANEQIQSGQVGAVIKSVQLSDTERLAVDHALNEYMAFADRWKASLIDIDSTAPIFSVFVVEYSALVAQYKSVEAIVAAHWQEYPARNQYLLSDYQLRAEKINDSIDGLIAAGARYQAMLDAITLAKILAGIAAKL